MPPSELQDEGYDEVRDVSMVHAGGISTSPSSESLQLPAIADPNSMTNEERAGKLEGMRATISTYRGMEE